MDSKTITINTQISDAKKLIISDGESFDFEQEKLNDDKLFEILLENNVPIILNGNSPIEKMIFLKKTKKDIYNFDCRVLSVDEIKRLLDELDDEIIFYFFNIESASYDVKRYVFDLSFKKKIVLNINDCYIFAEDNPYLNINDFVIITLKESKLLDYAIFNNLHPLLYTLILMENDEVFENMVPSLNRWKLASKILYETKNIYLLKGVIGEELTDYLYSLSKVKTISISDACRIGKKETKLSNEDKLVIEEYRKNIIVNICFFANEIREEYVSDIRMFISKYSSPIDALNIFDKLWTRDNEERKEVIRRIEFQELFTIKLTNL